MKTNKNLKERLIELPQRSGSPDNGGGHGDDDGYTRLPKTAEIAKSQKDYFRQRAQAELPPPNEPTQVKEAIFQQEENSYGNSSFPSRSDKFGSGTYMEGGSD